MLLLCYFIIYSCPFSFPARQKSMVGQSPSPSHPDAEVGGRERRTVAMSLRCTAVSVSFGRAVQNAAQSAECGHKPASVAFSRIFFEGMCVCVGYCMSATVQSVYFLTVQVNMCEKCDDHGRTLCLSTLCLRKSPFQPQEPFSEAR